jgi:hypothetical protein
MDRDDVIVEDGAVDPDGDRRPRRRRRWWLPLGAALVAMLAALGAGTWWSHGGAFLHAEGAGNGAENLPNQWFSVGVQLDTSSGESVTLDRVSAAQPNGAQVAWSVYKAAPGGAFFGPKRGALSPKLGTVPVHGYHVAQAPGHPELGGTWIVASMRAAHPGVYRLDHIKVTYHSGLHSRHATSDTYLCLLVYPPARQALILQQAFVYEPGFDAPDTVDPLVLQYVSCMDPTLPH